MAALPLVPCAAARVAPDETYILVRFRVALADVAHRVDPASALLLAMLLLVAERDVRGGGSIRERPIGHCTTERRNTKRTRARTQQTKEMQRAVTTNPPDAQKAQD